VVTGVDRSEDAATPDCRFVVKRLFSRGQQGKKLNTIFSTDK
jgi:hypothetical protein